MTPEQRRARGVAARAMLADSVIMDALAEMEADTIADWQAARWRFTRERLHADMRALQRLRHRLATMAGQGPRD